ncbi:MAG: phosphatase PAP2 family protein [Thermoleophilaceae bacterium]
MNFARRHWKLLALMVAIVIVVALYLAGVLPELPDAKKVIERVAQTLGPWTYVLVGALAFLETGAFVGLVAPGETAVMVGGVIAGQGEISLFALIGLVWICAVLGDTCSFFIGRRLGREFILKHGPRVKIDEDRLNTVESYFEDHGGRTIMIGRFVGLVRALAPFVIGSSGFPYRRFLPFSVIGCGLCATLYCVLGYIFYQSFDRLAGIAGKATLVFAIVVFIVVGGVAVYRRLRQPDERRRLSEWIERQSRRPLLRPLAALARRVWTEVLRPAAVALGPRVRFLGRRVTPGELGLEFTTTVAVAGFGLYVFVLYTAVIGGGRAFTPADLRLLDLPANLRVSQLTDVLKVVTDLGSFLVVAVLLWVTCLALALRRHFTEVVALLLGAVLLYLGVQLTKAGVDRPRPSMPLVDTQDSSFPSGHAAYSTVWVAVAVVVARALPGIASRAALVSIGLVVAVVVGLSRMYLRVHYWSDVAAGWGIGAAALGFCAAGGLIVSHVRKNDREPAPESRIT